MTKLETMLDPKTIALIGATEKEGVVGRIILENLLRSKPRKVFPINPNRKRVLEIDTYPDIASVPEHVDLAVIATPARSVPRIVEQCGAAGVDGVVIISAGFKEIGEEGRRLEIEIEGTRKKYGIRILGPNCLGFVRPPIGLNATFLKGDPPSGNIAFISQSGALGSAIVDWAVSAGIGFSFFASVGSMLDIDFGDLIDFLGDDYPTKSILLYMEGIGDAKKFMSAARAFARRKPIIILKPGRHTESARAAQSHTGAMAGDDAVYDAAFRRAGVVRVREIAELFDAAEVLDSGRLPRGPTLAIITNAGGPGVLATDALIDLGGELATLSDDSMREINSFLPPYWSHANPIDILGDARVESYAKALSVCLRDSMTHGVLIIYAPLESAPSDQVATTVAEIAKGWPKPVITTWMGAKEVENARKIFIQNNLPTYETPEEAVRAYVNMYKYKRNLDHLYETPAELSVRDPRDKQELKANIRDMLRKGRTLLNEEESKNLLVSYGIPATMPQFAEDADTAVSIAEKIGYPVAIKVVSPDISHKSDVGGVVLRLDSSSAVKKACETLMQTVGKRAPHAVIQGVTVQRMIQNVDYELILGSKKDKDFGAIILFGMGGTAAEIIKDFSIGLPPLNQTLAKMLMEETEVYKMLQGFRGRAPVHLKELQTILVGFSNLIIDFPEIAEIDINPLAIAQGKVYALDARMVLDRDYVEHTSRYPHLVITPYPARYTTTWKLPDSQEVLLRAIRPEDELLLYEMATTVSKETIRTRFFSSIKDMSHEWLIMFCNIDYDRHVAIVAEITENRKRKIIGVARIVMQPDFRSGEFAILTHDRYQHKGLGYKLVSMLIEIGRERGLEEIVGDVLTENEKMLKLAEKLGFTSRWVPGGTTRITLKLKDLVN
ncbi:MAG TPA: bifunctional acetate--CoA ligase family protein/GNAT family N-acetyltransferase [Syntrophorhabdales bacterium]|nr:bifunctional acetate--CoA ligase family protein/GNAT family N-acetyltransferase [Syntrophorhabdales bacterium]